MEYKEAFTELYKTAKEQNRISKRVQKLRLQGYMIEKGK